MFGYITPFKPEMKICEWDIYKAYYCGLCHEIKRSYGNFARFALNYDFVTLALLTDSLADVSVNISGKKCMASPIAKKQVQASTKGLALAAGGLSLSAFYKLKDDTNDEKHIKKIIAKLFKTTLKKAHTNAVKKFAQADLVMQTQMTLQQTLEQTKSKNPDEAAEPTAQMTSCLFSLAAISEKDKTHLQRIGYMMGKIIYFLDAAEDYDDDKKEGKYNVFSELSKEECIKKTVELCRLCHAEITLSYKELNVLQNKGILDNIIYMGINKSISFAGIKRKQERGRT